MESNSKLADRQKRKQKEKLIALILVFSCLVEAPTTCQIRLELKRVVVPVAAVLASDF